MHSHEQYAAVALQGEVSLEALLQAHDEDIAGRRAALLEDLRLVRSSADAPARLRARLERQLHRVNTDVAAALREVDRADCVRAVLGVLGASSSVERVVRWLEGLHPPGHPARAAAAEVARGVIREAAEGALRAYHEEYEGWLEELGGAEGCPERYRPLGRRIVDTRVAVEHAMRALLRGAGQGPG